jgi:hypothetical protein
MQGVERLFRFILVHPLGRWTLYAHFIFQKMTILIVSDDKEFAKHWKRSRWEYLREVSCGCLDHFFVVAVLTVMASQIRRKEKLKFSILSQYLHHNLYRSRSKLVFC